jgi:hypothetical protein
MNNSIVGQGIAGDPPRISRSRKHRMAAGGSGSREVGTPASRSVAAERGTLSRRGFCAGVLAASAAQMLGRPVSAAPVPETFRLKYILGSCMYGYTPLDEILPEVSKIGAAAIDIWPKVHGNQREQLDELGEAEFGRLLKQHQLTLGCLTQYKLGPFGLQEEMRLAQRLGCRLIVTGGKGPRGLAGKELKAAVADFLEQMQPHLAVAEATRRHDRDREPRQQPDRVPGFAQVARRTQPFRPPGGSPWLPTTCPRSKSNSPR